MIPRRRGMGIVFVAWLLGHASPVESCSPEADPWFFRKIRIESGPRLAGIHVEEYGGGVHVKNNTARGWVLAPVDGNQGAGAWSITVPANGSVPLPMDRLIGLYPGFGLLGPTADGRPANYEAPPEARAKLLARAGSESQPLELVSSYSLNRTYSPTRYRDGAAGCAAFRQAIAADGRRSAERDRRLRTGALVVGLVLGAGLCVLAVRSYRRFR